MLPHYLMKTVGQINNEDPFIYSLYHLSYTGSQGGLLENTFSITQTLTRFPSSLLCMYLDYRRKLGYPEETLVAWGEHAYSGHAGQKWELNPQPRRCKVFIQLYSSFIYLYEGHEGSGVFWANPDIQELKRSVL